MSQATTSGATEGKRGRGRPRLHPPVQTYGTFVCAGCGQPTIAKSVGQLRCGRCSRGGASMAYLKACDQLPDELVAELMSRERPAHDDEGRSVAEIARQIRDAKIQQYLGKDSIPEQPTGGSRRGRPRKMEARTT